MQRCLIPTIVTHQDNTKKTHTYDGVEKGEFRETVVREPHAVESRRVSGGVGASGSRGGTCLEECSVDGEYAAKNETDEKKK